MAIIPYGKQTIDDSDIAVVSSALKHDWITCGPKVEQFEQELCLYTGAKHAVAVNSGTSALDIAVAALNLPQGSEIITTPLTFVADANCILYNGHKPVFADIDKNTFNISPTEVKKKITPKTKAIICVDYAGQPCMLDELKEIADANGLYLIEDASHSFGAEYQGKKVGSFADLSVLSFHPVKPITTGEGGAVTTNNDEFAKRLRMLRSHGMDKGISERTSYKYDIVLLGRNYRITDFQCALGISQIKKLDMFIARRRQIAARYNEAFSHVPEVAFQKQIAGVKSGWHIYPILLDKTIDRDSFFVKMRENGIGVNVHYVPIYKFSLYAYMKLTGKDYPVTEDIYSRLITLPIFPSISDSDVDKVIQTVKHLVSL